MTPNEAIRRMTDTDIKKALECCSAESLSTKKCKQCPYHKRSSVQCIGRLCKDALDLIKRQQVEIEKLKEVKHGHWIPQYVSSRGLTDKFACSVCNGTSFTSHKYLNCPYKYCEECGARMDGE